MFRRSGPALYGLGLFPADFPEALQSSLHPQSAVAQLIAKIGWVMFVGGTLIFLAVLMLALYAVFAPRERRAAIGRRSLIVGGGVIFPAVSLFALLLYALVTADRIVDIDEPADVRIEVIGEQFWWRVRYLDAAGGIGAVIANEIHIPVDRPVDFIVKSADVIHSFWVPSLAGKIDMIPGRTNTLRIKADNTGTWRGQCAEYCGAQHGKMAFHVVVESPEAFAAWLAAQRRPAEAPDDSFLQRGKALFLADDCGREDCCADCHTVRGTAAEGDHGPDLTHVGSRRWIAAGTLPNNPGTLAGWIAASQHLKPGNHMPSFAAYEGEELRALAAYLESLK
ncbi:cytochrome c oxidase subunit II [Methylohalobius crimeensis]|uniref:cytochrome c oxidase subunit II n=1 Tax=Methylohalobius crimeensis TaxID=244365 RepID=UPI0003B40204|nr:cytochrome c oxidase subunit II [Methylohalobius crimeensis]